MNIEASIEQLEQSAADAELLALLVSHPEGKVKCSHLAEEFRNKAAALRNSTLVPPLSDCSTSHSN